ncbi:MAG TPA: hypothetical protein RMH99_01815 [Sandaracinaceae bacterium LLY-WYZ-13_1]|nr:hypothetical protein [Sandaracinaceae bacterium LLY-WYZ-13_1]
MSDARGGRPTFVERLGVLVESRAVRTGLVVLIILSVLPYDEIEDAFRPVFLLAFGAELAIRVPLLIRRRRTGRAGLGELAFLVIDFAAFLSFLPLEEVFHRHFEWLVFMRLSRLLVLMRFARELSSDLYSILTRREQLQQFGLVTIAVGALAFVSAVVLSQLEIPHDYDGIPEPASRPDDFWDQVWWSFRQLESADNLVANLHVNPVVGVLSLVLTIIGVFIISFIIGIGTNVVEQVVRAERRRTVSYAGHTVVVGPISESEILVREFVRIYSKNRRDLRDQLLKVARWLVAGAPAPRAWRLPRMALLGPSDEPPAVLLEPGMRWVVYRQGHGAETESLERIGAPRAKRAILLGDRSAGEDADAITVSTLAALREVNPHAHVFLELLSSRNYPTLHALGEGARTFPLDVPWFLGLFLLHHVVVPGVERLYQLLLTAEGSELYSHVYLEASEIEGLARLGDEDGLVSFETLARLAERHRVVLIGLLLGEATPGVGAHDLIDIDALVPWVNGHAEPADPRVAELGGRAGRVPAGAIRGVFAVGDTYQPVRSFARALAHRPSLLEHGEARPAPARIRDPRPPPRRILAVGYGDALASFTQRLAQLGEDAHVVVAFDGDPRHVQRLGGALARADVRLEAAGPARWEAALERGGRLEARADRPGDTMATARAVLGEEPVDAVVFLSEPDARDPDARTALRILQLAEHLLANEAPKLPHVLAELTSLSKGERARAQVELAFRRAGREPPRVTLVSTEQIRNYFMVHSAFVPGINQVYAGLLGERGQDLIRLPLEADGPVTMRAVRGSLARDGRVALGFERTDGTVALNPPPDEPFEARGVFAIGDADAVRR